jgi:hypothetical protein
MRSLAVRRCLIRLVPILVLGAAVGCGLGDYEEKMTEAQQRADRTDKENKLLDEGALDLPSDAAVEVFLRPPKHIKQGSEKERYRNRFCQYRGGGDFANVYLGWAKKDEEDFRNAVLSAFPGKVTKSENITTDPLGREGEVLSTWTLEDTNSNHTYYVYLTAGNKVAVVYEATKTGQTALETLQVSRDTLALGKEASAQRREFNKRRSPKK